MQKHRKLAAIMFTDIVGYTSLMSKDEHKALEILQKNRDVIKLLVGQFNGELLKEMGDGTLSSFGSVVDAVNCALEIQNSLRDETEFKLRIGIHIGDVVVAENGDVFGDGVNVASRIENIAEPGGICISEKVYSDIKNKPVLEATFLGEKKLKNVDDPVKVYSLTRGSKTITTSKPSIDMQSESRKSKNTKWVIIIAVICILVGFFGYGLYSRYTSQKITTSEIPTPGQEKIRSIAVLPFVDMSSNKDQEWFCDGISDAILNVLTHIGDLRVPGRTSSFSFKGKDTTFAEIGRQLNVESVLEGSIVKSGNRLRITAQLIKTDDGFHLWSETYKRETEDVFPLIEEISLKIVEALKIDLLSNEKATIEKRYTENIEAYNLYLQGRYYWNQRTEEGLKKAIELFQQAVEQDPTFALAYAGLADSYNILSNYGPLPANEVKPKAKASALKALEIDNKLAEAYTSLAFYRFSYEWDWEGADIEFKKAIELNPGYPTSHHWYAEYLSATGKLNESIAEMKRAQELDPLSPIINFDLGEKLFYIRRYDESIEQSKKTLEMYPNFHNAHTLLGRAYLQKGEYEEAVDAFQKAREITGATGPSSQLGYLYAISGERDKAEQILNALIERKKEIFVQSTSVALIYAGLGETDKAFEWLEKACEERTWSVTFLKVEPQWDSLRSDPRFKDLLKKIGLPE